jgi:pimeloyl-ACP methyl ester carboxylesterase
MTQFAGNFEVDGRVLNYQSAGSGAPLVFVHGSAGGAKQWKRLYEHFARMRHVFAYDLIGCGGNRPLFIDAFHGDLPETDDRHFSFEDDARALKAAIDRFDQPVDVIAHSVGGIGALLAALDRPEAVRTLTLFEPVLFTLLRDSGDSAFEPVRDIATRYRLLFERKGPRAAMEAFVDFWNGAGSWERLKQSVRHSMLSGANRLYLEWGLVLYARADVRLYDLPRLRQPVLYFTGWQTIPAVKRLTDIAVARIPNVRAVSLLGAGHMAPFTHAAQVIPDIEEHLNGNSAVAAVSDRRDELVRWATG